MESPGTDRVRVRCACGAKLKVSPALIGRTIKCPKCGTNFVAESEEEPLTIAPLDLGGDEDAAPRPKPPTRPPQPAVTPSGPPCALCGAPQAADAILCVQCGYDKRTGKRISSQTTAVKRVSRLAKLAGTFLMGCGLSALGAGIGAAIWFIIVLITDYEIGWIAWGVGILAGAGMALGAREKSTRAGVAAAMIALAGILIGKAAVFVFVIYTMVTGDTDDVKFLRLHVQQQFTEEDLSSKGIWKEDERAARWEGAWESAGKRVAKMTDAEVRSRAEGYRDQEKKEEEKLSEVGLLRGRLAWHQAELKAEAEGRAWNDPQRTRLAERAQVETDRLPESEVHERIKKLDEWKAGGRWADEAHVRDRLAFARIEAGLRVNPPPGLEELEDLDPSEWEIPAKIWQGLHGKAVADVKAMSHEQRVAALKQSELEAEDRGMRERLVYHYTDLNAEKAGVYHADEAVNDALGSVQEERFKGHTHEQLLAEIATLDAWEKDGKWSDADYLKAHLTSMLRGEEEDSRRDAERKGDPEGYWTPSAEEWKAMQAKASQAVAAIPPEQHAQRIRDIEAAVAKKREERFAAQESEETAKALSGLGMAFASTLVHPMNLLFFFLGVSSAFKIATKGLGRE